MNNYAGYKLVIEKKAQKFLQKLEKKIYKEIVLKIASLKGDSINQLNIKKLKAYKNVYRLRLEQYRIIFVTLPKEKILFITLVAHRKEVYDVIKKLSL